MDKLLYIVESPFQLLGVLESIAHYSILEYKLVIRLSNRENEKQLIKIIEDLKYDKNKITFISGYKYGELIKKFIELKFLIWLFFHKNNYTKLFLGDYHSRYLTLLQKVCLNNKKIIYLDDGSSTIRANNSFTKDNYFDWFTIYDLESFPNQVITKHDFPTLRKIINKNIESKTDITVILGDKLYEAGLLTKEDSNTILKQLLNRLKGEKLLYMAHRGESEEKLDYIKNEYNIEVVKNDFPIELYGLYHNSLPKKVVSFFSTALYSLQIIYPEVEVEVYRMDTTMFSSHVEAYDRAYKAYEAYMKVIDLDD